MICKSYRHLQHLLFIFTWCHKLCPYLQSQVELCFSLLVVSCAVPHAAVEVLLPLRDKLLLQVWPPQVVSVVPSPATREREYNRNNLCQLFNSQVFKVLNCNYYTLKKNADL